MEPIEYAVQIRRPLTSEELAAPHAEYLERYGELVASTTVLIAPDADPHTALMTVNAAHQSLLGKYRWNHPIILHVMTLGAWYGIMDAAP